jgi:zinc D-Ala-D-Ala carboxypeptidase
MKLSEHFTLEEFLVSETASRHGIDNKPDDKVVENLKLMAVVMEEVRDLIGRPVVITSGYRSVRLNSAVGGSMNSAHTSGLAADFIVPPLTPLTVCEMIAASEITYDQLIYEHTWVHLGLTLKGAPRFQKLTLLKNGSYIQGFKA